MATDTYINSVAGPDNVEAPAGFGPGDVLVSPSGTFNGRLQADGNFIVSYGPNPNTSLLWAANYSNPSAGPYALYYVFGNGVPFYFPWNGVGQAPYVLLNTFPTSGTKPTFLQLNDNGTLSLYPGTNGVATGSARAARGNSATFQNLELTSINYDLAQATFPQVNQVYSVAQTLTNSSHLPATQTTTLSLTYSNTQTYDWSVSHTVSVTIGAQKTFGVPVIGDTKLSMQLGYSTTISHGESTSSGQQTTYQSQVSVTVPPNDAVGVQIVAYQQDALVPFTYTGVYHFTDGTSVPASGTGEFEGVSTGVFDARVYPISSPSTTLYEIPISPTLMTFQDAGQSVSMTGDNGNDDFVGTTGNDTITAGTGTNKIDPGNGNDLIISEGNDTIYPGAGSDTVFAVGQDLAAVGTGTLSFVNGDNPATVIGGSTGTAVINGGAGGGLFAGGSGDANIIVGGTGAATIFGSSGPDLLFAGGSNPDLLAAGSGNETLSGLGSSGNNVMWAGAGTDLMGGGSGDETFFAGQGNATIISGSGADLFAFVNGQAGGSDVVVGFNPGQGDLVDLQGYGANEVQNALGGATVANGNTTITLSDHTSITFAGVSNLTQSAFT